MGRPAEKKKRQDFSHRAPGAPIHYEAKLLLEVRLVLGDCHPPQERRSARQAVRLIGASLGTAIIVFAF